MRKNLKEKFILFFIFLIITIGIYLLSSRFADNRVNDFCTKIITVIKNKKASDKVVLIAIDDKSLNQIKWPWRRDLFSDIFDFLEQDAGAKAIVFDNLILFPDTYYPESDSYFIQRLKKQNKLINSYILYNSNVSGDVLPEEYVKIFNEKISVNIRDERTNKKFASYRGIINIPKDFLYNVKNLASSVIPEDNDEIVRSYMPVVAYADKLYPSLAILFTLIILLLTNTYYKQDI